jgi:hypothetical protein
MQHNFKRGSTYFILLVLDEFFLGRKIVYSLLTEVYLNQSYYTKTFGDSFTFMFTMLH